jgi:hypothetical protein
MLLKVGRKIMPNAEGTDPLFGVTTQQTFGCHMYEGDSNENLKSAIKIKNTARLSCKLIIMIIMV